MILNFRCFRIEGISRGNFFNVVCKNVTPLLEIAEMAVVFGTQDAEPTTESVWEFAGNKLRYDASNDLTKLEELYKRDFTKLCQPVDIKKVSPVNCFFFCAEAETAKEVQNERINL